MLSVYAYYDGQNYITDGSVAIKPNQNVIITLLDDAIKPVRNLKKYVGAVSKEDSDLVLDAVKECRKVDVSEW